MNSKLLTTEDLLLATSISETLIEKEIDLIQSIIQFKGADFALNILGKVQKIMAEGGLLKKNGEKRAPGGIFFQIVKESCSKTEYTQIFRPQITERRRRSRARKQVIKLINSLSL